MISERVRRLQRTFAAIWHLPSSGVREYWRSLLASATLVVEFAALVLLAPVLAVLLGSVFMGLVVHTVTATLLRWPIQLSWLVILGLALKTRRASDEDPAVPAQAHTPRDVGRARSPPP